MYTDLIRAGVKPENIIMMVYYTVLTSSFNPYPGKIFTDPADNLDGDWARYGCFDHVDYTNQHINKKVFLGILSGDIETVKSETKMENPKVLNAGPEDTVFTYFIDHGSDDKIVVGLDHVTSKSFLEALETAYEKKIYGKWVWYMEACHSGSMWKNLSTSMNIYVMTSSDSDHDAKMTHCPPDDVVAERSLGTCLGGLWDNLFLDYLEQNPDCTFGAIADAVKTSVAETSDQNVSEFGDLSFRDDRVAEFFGLLPSKHLRAETNRSKPSTNVAIPDVPVHLAKWAAIRAPSHDTKPLEEYQREVVAQAKQEVEVMRLGRLLMNEKAVHSALNTRVEAFDVECVKELSLKLVEKCGQRMPFQAKQNNVLRRICIPGVSLPVIEWEDICL